MNIGIIGCGDIAQKAYLPGCRDFPGLMVVALADMDVAKARQVAHEQEIPWAGSVDDLLGRDEVELVINLTIPKVHAEIDERILRADKHAYSEKPLALNTIEAKALVDWCADHHQRLGCAPDTVLGAGLQRCRQLLDAGAIGTPLHATAFMACPGHEHWHPNPAFYYDHGGGPLYDMGPYYLSALVNLLGPVQTVCAMSSRGWEERRISSEPLAGTLMPVTVDTHISASLRFASGVIGTVIMSFDTWRHHLPKLELHGRDGSMVIPDPNGFGGPVLLNTRQQPEWQEQELRHPLGRRGLGVAEMAAAIAEGRPHRCSLDLAFHVQEIMDAILEAGSKQQTVTLRSTCQRPQPLPEQVSWRSGA